MDIENRKLKIDVILAEYQRACAEIRSIESNNEKVIGFGLTLISFGFVSGLSQDISEIYIILPPAIVGVLLYGMMTYSNVFSLAGYKRHLEDELNALMEARPLVWEQLVIERERWNAARVGLLIVYFAVSSAVISVSILELVDAYGWEWTRPMIGFVLLLFLLLLAGAVNLGKINDHTYERSKELSSVQIGSDELD